MTSNGYQIALFKDDERVTRWISYLGDGEPHYFESAVEFNRAEIRAEVVTLCVMRVGVNDSIIVDAEPTASTW